jgi:hypothetical protein
LYRRQIDYRHGGPRSICFCRIAQAASGMRSHRAGRAGAHQLRSAGPELSLFQRHYPTTSTAIHPAGSPAPEVEQLSLAWQVLCPGRPPSRLEGHSILAALTTYRTGNYRPTPSACHAQTEWLRSWNVAATGRSSERGSRIRVRAATERSWEVRERIRRQR